MPSQKNQKQSSMTGAWVCSPYGWKPSSHILPCHRINNDDTMAAAILCSLSGNQDAIPLSIFYQMNKEE